MLSKQSRIFITGSTGFLGSYIVRKLHYNGYQHLYCLKRKPSSLELVADVSANVTWVEGDILDLPFLTECLEGMDVIIHSAAMVNFNTSQRKQMLHTAIEGTANLVNLAMQHGIKKFVHISSVAALGRKKVEENITENTIFSHSKYDTSYALSKFLAEQEVWRAYAEGLNVTVLNPSLILGAGRWNESSIQIIKKIHNGLPFYPSGSTGWVDVRDVAHAVSTCLTEQFNGERYIISSENATYKQVFGHIAALLKKSPPAFLLGKKMGAILWRLEAIKSFLSRQQPIITQETIQSTSTLSSYDNTKSINALGMNYMPLESTISACCAAFVNTLTADKKYGVLDFQ
jgi:nucleoside-diphosphate-sugar epimerase